MDNITIKKTPTESELIYNGSIHYLVESNQRVTLLCPLCLKKEGILIYYSETHSELTGRCVPCNIFHTETIKNIDTLTLNDIGLNLEKAANVELERRRKLRHKKEV